MIIVRHQHPNHFRDRANPFLRQDPSRNQLIFDLAQRLESFTDADHERLMWTIEDAENEVKGAALRTDAKRSLILSDMSLTAVEPIIEGASGVRELDGILGVKETAEYFHNVWSKAGLPQLTERMRLRLYDLTEVIPPRLTGGQARLAVDQDLGLLSQWLLEFSKEALNPADNDLASHVKAMTKCIEERRQWVWSVNREVVAMTVWTGKNEFGTKITGVYTPKNLRGRGYASSLVASVTQQILNDGAPRAFIYTDLKNPTSNSIYQNVGYRHVCDFLHFGFDVKGRYP